MCSVAEMQNEPFLQIDLKCNNSENEQAGLFCVLSFFLPLNIYFPFRHQTRGLFDLMCLAAPVCSQLSPDVLHFENSSPEF